MRVEICQPQSAAKWTVPEYLSLSGRVSLSSERDLSPTQNYVKNICCTDKSRTVPGFSLKISFQCLYSSLYFGFSLTRSLSISVSLLLLCGFSNLFLCYIVCLPSGFCFCASHGAFPRVFHLPMRSRRVVPKLYCVLSVFSVFLLGFAFAKSSKQDTRARATDTQIRMQVPRAV